MLQECASLQSSECQVSGSACAQAMELRRKTWQLWMIWTCCCVHVKSVQAEMCTRRCLRRHAPQWVHLLSAIMGM